MIKKTQIPKSKWSRAQLESYIKSESRDSSNVVFTDHAKKQMKDRKIISGWVTETLQKGKIKRTPEPNLMKGTLECRMEYYVAGSNIGIIVAISDDDPTLLIVTAMYI